MPLVQIEHPIRDFDAWKAAFDRDPAHRELSGVRRYAVYRPVDDPNYVAVDLEFDTRAEAEQFTRTMEGIWKTPQAATALAGAPRARIVDVAERKTY